MTHHLPYSDRCNSRSTIHLSLAALLLLTLVGCGTGEYERRLSGRTARLQAQAAAKFNELGNPQEVAGTNVSVRLPRVFKEAPLAEGAADARRVKPGIVTIAGLKLTDEGFIQDAEGGQLPFYCYVGVTSDTAQNAIARLQQEVGGKPGKIVPWADFSVQAPDGQTVKWQKLRFEGNQEFYYKNKAGQEDYPSVPGVLELYVHEEGGQAVIVAWRMPLSIEPNVGLDRLAPLVAGCVTVKK